MALPSSTSPLPTHPPIRNDVLIRAAMGQVTERAPVWVMRQAGRYLPEFRKLRETHAFFDICQTPSLATDITLQPIRRYAGLLDGAIIFSDILVIPQAFGMEVVMNPGPVFPNPIESEQQMEQIIADKLDQDDLTTRLGYVYEAIQLTVKELQSEIPLIGFVGAPWTLFAYMTSRGTSARNHPNSASSSSPPQSLNASQAASFDRAKRWLFEKPNLSLQLLDKLAWACGLHLSNQIKAGCSLAQVFDSWAGELSSQDFKQFSLPFLRKIATFVKQDLIQAGLQPAPLIIFAKGINQPEDLKLLADSGYSTIALDWKVEPRSAIEALGPKSSHVALQGNLDPAVLLSQDHDRIRHYVKLMFDPQQGGFRPDRPHIANLGHGITPGVHPEAMKTFLQAVHEEGRSSRAIAHDLRGVSS